MLREVREWARTFGSAVVYAAFIVTFIGQVARVDGSSMQPTLENDDRLIVNKLAYELHSPRVGDVVMLLSPDEPDTALVKRVVAAHYFVMGDHRNNSRDSRTFRFVPQKYILGKVQVRWWPVGTARLF